MNLGLCIEMAFARLPFERRLAAAAKAGFQYVEMWFVDGSFRGTGEQLAGLAKKHGVSITNTVIGSPDGAGKPTIWSWRKQASSADLGVHGVYILYWDDHSNKMAMTTPPTITSCSS